MSGWLFLIMMQFIPIIIGNFVATNRSLLRQIDISPEQFGENMIYVLIVYFTGIIVITATLSMVLAYLRHICMMLKITW